MQKPIKLPKNKILILTAIFFSLGASLATADNSPAYNKGKFFIAGGYTLNKANISRRNGGLKINRYGTTSILDSEGQPIIPELTTKPIVIRDQHYRLINWTIENNLTHIKQTKDPIVTPSDNKGEYPVGIRVVPVVNGAYATDIGAPEAQTGSSQGHPAVTIRGSTLVDEYLRKNVYGYTDEAAINGPIYAQILYYLPEHHKGQLSELAGKMYKTEMGMTHKGAYYGKGHTRNSPEGYHDDTWFGEEDFNYPAIMHVMDFAGAKDATGGKFNPELFNLNAQITNLLLNQGVTFPEHEHGYKFDKVYTITLKNSLDYYKRWLEGDRTLKEDFDYQAYCAEHTTMAINIALNLPQNEAGYKKVYGVRAGGVLWGKAKTKWLRLAERSRKLVPKANTRNGLEGVVSETYVPMWELLRQPNPINDQGIAAAYTDVLGRSLGWRAETVADLARDFVSTYSRWNLFGPSISTLSILGFNQESKVRMGIENPAFFELVTPVVQKTYAWDAAAQIVRSSGGTVAAANSEAIRAKVAELKTKYHADLNKKLTALVPDAKVKATMLQSFLADLENAESVGALAIKLQDTVNAQPPATPIRIMEVAYDQFQVDVRTTMEAINKVEPDLSGGAHRVKFYYPPATHGRVANLTHDAGSEERTFFKIYPVMNVIRSEQTEPVTATEENPFINSSYVAYDIYGTDEVVGQGRSTGTVLGGSTSRK